MYLYMCVYVIYIYIIPTDYWGGPQLTVTYIFGDMLPQKCKLQFPK